MAPQQSAQPLLGIALKVISTLAFAGMATLIKLVGDRYPTGEIVFFRSFFALIPVFAFLECLAITRALLRLATFSDVSFTVIAKPL